MLEEELKNKIAAKYFKKFDCTDIIKRIDFSVKCNGRCTDVPWRVSTVQTQYLLWAEAKQQPTDIYRMLAQLLITIKADAWDITPPKFLGCFDSEKIAFVPFYDVQPVFLVNDFNWTQTPSAVDEKTVETVRNAIDKNKILTFRLGDDDENISNFVAKNFNEQSDGNYLATLIDKNNFIFVYQKWLKAVKPHINADWETLKKNYAVYDRDFFLAELNIDDQGTTDITDDKTVNDDFYITFDATAKKPYQLLRRDGLGMEILMPFGFKGGGLEHYAEFWKLYKRPPKDEIWKYIISRLDLLVPQDVRERKGAFFTPQIWVELSQKYIADVLGPDWQDEYYVWDCCAGTGNLLNGLTNKYRIFASTLDQQDVDVMRERIRNGANLLDSHVFQFDFLNDDFSKCPPALQEIISDDKKREKLIVYINPPYAEATTARTITGTGQNKSGVATANKIYQKYKEKIGKASNEIYAQFMIRMSEELQRCKIANFAKLKALCASNFADFRNVFLAKLEKLFVVPAKTFDNVKGTFPIGFFVWDTNKKEKFSEIYADAYNADTTFFMQKKIQVDDINALSINRWMKKLDTETQKIIGYMENPTPDFQNNKFLCIINNKGTRHNNYSAINENTIFVNSIYFSVRQCITADWLNDRDQFLWPNDGWKTDTEFQTNCLVYTLFHGQNRISVGSTASRMTRGHAPLLNDTSHAPNAAFINHWIPFTEAEVDAKEAFRSHFMSDFLKGKVKARREADLFSDLTPKPPLLRGEGEVNAAESQQNTETESLPAEDNSKTTETKAPRPQGEGFGVRFSEAARSVLDAGRELWRYYHTMEDANPDAALYDIKEYFQGRNDKGKMNASSDDPVYTELMGNLKAAMKALAEEIKPKVYEYGFLR